MTTPDPVAQAIADAKARAASAGSAPASAAPATPAAPPGFRYDAASNSFVPDTAPAAPAAPPGFRYDAATNSFVPDAPAAAVAPTPAAAPATAPAAAPAAYGASPQVPATTTPGGAVQGYDPNQYQAGRKLTMAEMMSGRSKLNVDYFLGVDENGIKVRFMRDDPKGAQFVGKLVHSLLLDVNFATDVRLCFGIRYEDPITKEFTYVRTGDRVFADDGTPWQTVIAKAMQSDKSCRGDYPSVDLAGVLVNPLVASDGTQILLAGARVGFSTSVMNWQSFQRCHDDMLARGLVEESADGRGLEGRVYMKIGFKAMTNKQNKHYGIFTFECMGDAGGDQIISGAGAAPLAATAAAQPSIAHTAGPIIDAQVQEEKPKRARRAAAAPAATEPAAPPAGMPAPPPGFRYDAATNSYVPA